jgi:hypothetical protein
MFTKSQFLACRHNSTTTPTVPPQAANTNSAQPVGISEKKPEDDPWWWVPSPKTIAVLTAVGTVITWITKFFTAKTAAIESGAELIAIERDEVVTMLKSSQISATELVNLYTYLLRAEPNAFRHGVDPQVFCALLAQSANQYRPDINKLQLWDALCFYRLSPFFDAKRRSMSVSELMCGASMLAQDPLRPDCKMRAAFHAADRDLDRKLTFDQTTDLITSMIRTGHISARSLPERVSLFPFPTYSVRTPLQITNLLYSEVKKQPNELISFDEFSIAATQLTNDGERLVWWYLLENRADSVERRKKLDIAEGRVAAAVE